MFVMGDNCRLKEVNFRQGMSGTTARHDSHILPSPFVAIDLHLTVT